MFAHAKETYGKALDCTPELVLATLRRVNYEIELAAVNGHRSCLVYVVPSHAYDVGDELVKMGYLVKSYPPEPPVQRTLLLVSWPLKR